jgi:5-methylthioadenosine/S-adenosylhomocysteine deaminase
MEMERKFARCVVAFLSIFAVQCTADAGDYVVTGTVVSPDNVIVDGAVSVSGQTIAAVGQRTALARHTTTIATGGIILPGFIDLHNHLTWNILPRWIPGHRFRNRYEWQDSAEYDRVLQAPHTVAVNEAECEAEIFAEIKVLAGGATSAVGSPVPSDQYPDYKACARGLVRNLDTFSDISFTPPAKDDACEAKETYEVLFDWVDNEIFPFEISNDRIRFLGCVLKSGELKSLVIHLSEGAPTDSSAHREFAMLKMTGLITPGLVIVHGTALRAPDFKALAEGGAGLVWSPRSNDELYGASTNIPAAIQAKLPVAIAPDWSPSGSAGMLQELGYAYRHYSYFTPNELVAAATSVPAKMARLDDKLGTLSPGMLADLVVIRDKSDTPSHTVVTATPADVLLVIVGGQPLYGDKDLMTQLLPGKTLDSLTVCGVSKRVYLGDSVAPDRHENLDAIIAKLGVVLQSAGSSLAPIECD